MRKRLLLIFIVLLSISSSELNAQTSYETNCTMTVEEILRKQSWDIDHPKSENARNISIGLFSELANINDKLNNGLTNEVAAHLQAITSFVEAADELGMNYSMFEADLTFIETLN